MRKKLKTVILGLAVLLLVVGTIFALMRPAYVSEALDILFKNELDQIEHPKNGGTGHAKSGGAKSRRAESRRTEAGRAKSGRAKQSKQPE